MNFSINRKLCRNLSLILVFIMIFTLFAGCKKDSSEDNPPAETPGLNINLTDSTVPTVPEAPTETTEATEPEGDNMATVTSRMNVRAKPAVDAVIVYTLEAGDRIEITRQQYVVGYDWGYTPTVPGGGWIVMDFVEMDNKSETPPESMNNTPAENAGPIETPAPGTNESTSTTKIRATVTATELKIRSEGSTSGKVLGKYKKGEKITILETKNGWGRTDTGWVSMDYVSTTDSGSSSSNNSSSSTTATIESNGNTSVLSKGVVKTGELNVRASASSKADKVGSYKYGARVEILETSGGWGRTSKGWIHMDYVYKDGTTGKNTDSGTVTGDELNIRSGPGTEYTSLGHYDKGDTVKILEKFTYGNVTWGCTNKGWIALTYVDLDSKDDEDNDNSDAEGRTGWITAEELNIREGAGTSYDEVGSYLKGDKVTILETEGNWGRTSKGWISLSFVDFDNDPDDNDGDYKTGTGVVTATELRIREGAGTSYEVVGSYEEDDEITILEVKDGWGRTKHGWVDLDYVEMD